MARTLSAEGAVEPFNTLVRLRGLTRVEAAEASLATDGQGQGGPSHFEGCCTVQHARQAMAASA